ncbi:sensor histidine kinase [Aeromicrobium sp. Sec7.5]|uniref:sensor histidine kinase n=1 Tax=Aeromicrobium sp. Sec7.5 TaxID=3121276 RepID=UPI002FE4BAF8
MTSSVTDVDALIAEQHVIDSPPAEWQSIVELAAFMADVPMATINILTADAQHQVAAVGFDAAICRREDSMCRLTVESGESIVVEDARFDDRYRDNPFVTGVIGDVRFYASTPLVLPGGEIIGTLCVFDLEPRVLDATRTAFLLTLADRIVDVLGLAQRTSQLAEALARTEALRDELHRSNEHLSAFAGQISHDLSSLLSTVSMSIDLLDEQIDALPDPPEDAKFWIDTAQRGSDRMGAMIRDILSFASLGGSLRLRPTPLGGVVKAVALDLGIAPDDPRLAIGELPVVSGDAGQLRAVVQNLVTNALKFGGEDPRVEISAVEDQDAWEIRVSDRGVGIDPADAERVFEPLERAHPELPGTGIGLATSRRVIESHGGTIGLRPREGGGAEAWFRLPAANT